MDDSTLHRNIIHYLPTENLGKHPCCLFRDETDSPKNFYIAFSEPKRFSMKNSKSTKKRIIHYLLFSETLYCKIILLELICVNNSHVSINLRFWGCNPFWSGFYDNYTQDRKFQEMKRNPFCHLKSASFINNISIPSFRTIHFFFWRKPRFQRNFLKFCTTSYSINLFY